MGFMLLKGAMPAPTARLGGLHEEGGASGRAPRSHQRLGRERAGTTDAAQARIQTPQTAVYLLAGGVTRTRTHWRGAVDAPMPPPTPVGGARSRRSMLCPLRNTLLKTNASVQSSAGNTRTFSDWLTQQLGWRWVDVPQHAASAGLGCRIGSRRFSADVGRGDRESPRPSTLHGNRTRENFCNVQLFSTPCSVSKPGKMGLVGHCLAGTP